MKPFLYLVVTDKAETSIMDALPHLAGMLLVIITLCILWGICVITSKLIQVFRSKHQGAAACVERPLGGTADSEGLSHGVLATIAAAVASVTYEPHRIISIKPSSVGREKPGRQSARAPAFGGQSLPQDGDVDRLRITVDGRTCDVMVERLTRACTGNPRVSLQPARATTAAMVPPRGGVRDPLQAPVPPGTGKGRIHSPLAGIVQTIEAAVGTTLKEGDVVLTLEAMKMRTPVNAPMNGTITGMFVKVGDAVDDEQLLYTIR